MNAVFSIAANTLKEALRQKLLLIVALVALLLVVASKYLLKLDLGHEQLRFVFDFGSGALGFFGSIIAVVAACQLFHSEMENKTIITLMSKPVGFSEFVFGKLAGAAVALAIFVVIIAAATCAMLFFTNASFGESAERLSGGLQVNYAGVLAFAFAQWLKLCTIAAVAALICSVSRSLLFSVIISFMVIAASMMGSANAWLGADKTLITQISAAVFPDFQIFNTTESFAFAPVKFAALGMVAAYAAVYIAACGALGAWLFSRREF